MNVEKDLASGVGHRSIMAGGREPERHVGFIADQIQLPASARLRLHPDADLLQAWRDCAAADIAYINASEAEMEEMGDQLEKALDEADDRITSLHATTLEGVAVKIRQMLKSETLSVAYRAEFIAGAPADPNQFDEITATLLCSVLNDVDRMICRARSGQS